MAEVEDSIVTHLKAQSAVSAIVGTRVYDRTPDPKTPQPYISVHKVDDPRAFFTQTAYGGMARISIYCYAKTEASAKTLGETVLAVYDGVQTTVGSHTSQWIEISNARLLRGPAGNDHRYLVDMVVHYT